MSDVWRGMTVFYDVGETKQACFLETPARLAKMHVANRGVNHMISVY